MLFLEPRNGKPLEDQGGTAMRILYHWEMSSSRNAAYSRFSDGAILYHWEMSSSRNYTSSLSPHGWILYHWEMSSSRN